MFLFIDTNIFLSFYHYTNDDLDELEKLILLADTKKLTLLLPTQVVDEFYRNRDNKINDALKGLKSQKLNLQFPQICKDYEEYNKLRDLQKKYEKHHSELLAKLDSHISNESLKADETVHKLFNSAYEIEIDDKSIERAKTRMAIGNPPGKSGSLGDAINWESLIEKLPNENDLYFITDDKDYYSTLSSDAFNNFLLKEWKEKKDSELIYYKKLSDFFKENFPDINLSGEFEKDILIQGLSSSSNFAQTHKLISKLRKFTEFTHAQANDIISAAVSNNQIYWIIDDEDVNEFIRYIIDKYEDVIEEDNLEHIQHYLSSEVENVNDEDDLPF